MTINALSQYMLRLRESYDLNQVDFSEKIGISKTYLCDIEKGRRNISLNKAISISKELHINPLQFIQLIIQDWLDRDKLQITVKLENQLIKEHKDDSGRIAGVKELLD